MPNETRKWLYDQLSSKGVNLGSYEQYDKAYDNDEYVKWFYDTAIKSGFNMGSYEQFVGAVKPKEPPVDTSEQIVQEDGLQQAATTTQPSGRVERRRPTQEERERITSLIRGESRKPEEVEEVAPASTQQMVDERAELRSQLEQAQKDGEAVISEYDRRWNQYQRDTDNDLTGPEQQENKKWLDDNNAQYRAAKDRINEIKGRLAYIDRDTDIESIDEQMKENQKHVAPKVISTGGMAPGYNPYNNRQIDQVESSKYEAANTILGQAKQTLRQGNKYDPGYEGGTMEQVWTAAKQFVEGGLNNIDMGSLTFGLTEGFAMVMARSTGDKSNEIVNATLKDMGYKDEDVNKLIQSMDEDGQKLTTISGELNTAAAELENMQATLEDMQRSGASEGKIRAYAKQYNQKIKEYNTRVKNEFEPLAASYDETAKQYETIMSGIDAALDRGLSDGDKALLSALEQFTDAKIKREGNVSVASAAGAGAEQSAEFMLDFILTGGLAKAGTKAATKLTSRRVLKKFGADAARQITKPSFGAKVLSDAVVAAERTAIMFPRNLAAYGEQLTQMTGKDNLGRYNFDRSHLNAALNTVLTQYIGYWSEGFGEYFGAGEQAMFRNVTKAAPRTAIGKTLGQYRGSIGKYLDYGKFDGMFNEMLEEVVDSSLNSLAGWMSGDCVGDQEALKDFFSGEQLATLALSFLPMSAISARTNIKAYNKMKNRYNESVAVLNHYLDSGAISREELEGLVSDIAEKTPEEIKDSIVSIADKARASNGGMLPQNFTQSLMGYVEGSFAMSMNNETWENSQEKMQVVNAYADQYDYPDERSAYDLAQLESEARTAALEAGYDEDTLDRDPYTLARLAQGNEDGSSRVLMDYAMAKAANQGLKDGYKEQTKALFGAFEEDVRRNLDVNGSVIKATLPNGRTVYIDSKDAKVTPDGRITTPTGEEGLVSFRYGSASPQERAKASVFTGATAQEIDTFLWDEEEKFFGGREQNFINAQNTTSPAGMARALNANIGNTVFFRMNGIYEPMQVDRLTQDNTNVVVSGDPKFLNGLATMLGLQSPGGQSMELPIETIWPMLATNDDGSLATNQPEAEAAQPAEAPASPQAQSGAAMLDGRPIGDIRLDEENGWAYFTYQDDPNGMMWVMDIDEFRQKTGQAEAPAQEGMPAAPAEEPQAPTEDETPAEEAPQSKIPVDKDGNKIYDAPGVEPIDAYDDMYSTPGLTEEDVDEWVIAQSDEAEKNRNPKIKKGQSLADWGAAKAEANRVADFWKQFRDIAEERAKEREEARKLEAERQKEIEKYGVDTRNFDLTPQTVEEAVANYLGNNEGIIDLDDAKKEVFGKSGRIPSELFRHAGNGGILTKKGGRTIADVANDIVGEYEGQLPIEQDAVRDLIIDYLARYTKTEMRDMIFNNRLNAALAELEQQNGASSEVETAEEVVDDLPEAEEEDIPAEEAVEEAPEGTAVPEVEEPVAEPAETAPATETGSVFTTDTPTALLSPADIVEIYNGREATKEADKGKAGRKEIINALHEANPAIVQFRNDQDQINAIEDVVNLARQYPDLAISKIILNKIGAEVAEENEPTASETPGNSVPSQEEGGFQRPVFTLRNSTDQAQARNNFVEAVGRRLIFALQNGTEKPYRSITDLRKEARAWGLDVEDSGATDILLQELVELALVKAARALTEQNGIKSKNAFDQICRLYELQPTIGRRSSERIAMQQYSTPLPMSFVAQMFAYNGRMKEVLEPTAGNGMLVFGIPGEKVHANELDDTRNANLQALGFGLVSKQDATEPFGGKYDAVIANPPFGSHDAVEFDGKQISGLDPIITLRALDAMKDGGKAAIIIGGNVEFAENGAWKTKKAFFSYLYDHYNVKGVVNMAGDLYAKQGTTYPTMMILIDGRRSEEERAAGRVYPPTRENAQPTASTYDELYDIVKNILNDNRKTDGNEIVRAEGERQPSDSQNGQPTLFDRGRGVESDTNGDNAEVPGQRGGNDSGAGVPGVDGNADAGKNQKDAVVQGTPSGERQRTVRNVPDAESGEPAGRGGDTGVGSVQEPVREPGQSDVREGSGNGAPGEAGRESSKSVSGREPSVRKPVRVDKEKRKVEDKNLSYVQHSGGNSLESVAPAAMVEAMDAALSKIEKEVGKSIDEFVMDELGYKSGEELYNALAAEQIDSVAMAIYNMKRGGAMIIGDQTGVGKGRQMAALIRWANRQGKKPIFMTQRAGLFSDIYRDMEAIGSGSLKPLILNAVQKERDKETGEMHHGDRSGVMLKQDEDGNLVEVYTSPTDSVLKKIIESGKVPDGYDYVVLTYSQLNNGDEQSRSESKKKLKISKNNANSVAKAKFIRGVSDGNYLLLDESHTAAGSGSNSGAFLQSVVPSAGGVTFSSATFAKRPDTMPLYAIKSAISQANVDPKELIQMIERGGVTLQEIMARALTDSGEMVRRERDMSDVKTDWKTIDDPATSKRARENYDKAIRIFNDIIEFQHKYIDAFVAQKGSEIAIMMETASRTRGTENFGIDNPSFVSQTYNFTKQLMLALKVDAIVDEVVKEINSGRHPVIALENTYESGIKAYEIGDEITDTSFSAGLLRSLERIMQYTVKDEEGEQTTTPINPSQLGPAGEKAYRDLQERIREATKDIFLSPLDAIIDKLSEKGYKVGEVTGRKTHVVRGENGYELAQRSADAKQAVADFNSGKSDVIIINKSGSTGISLHASKLFKDRRQRSMIIAQPLGDINDYMQMIGRIDRTGQVHRGYYINLSLPVPAELRFNMMLASKLKSLNANTTTSQESDTSNVEAPDFLNKYGSQVIIEYLRDNPVLFEKLVEETELKLGDGQTSPTNAEELEEYKASDDDAKKVTGRIALLPVVEQEAFYNDIAERYNSLIKYLDETGENTLKITTLPLKAKTLARKVATEGRDPNGSNPFAQNSYVERVEVDVLKKPMKADEIRRVRESLLNGKTPQQREEELTTRIETQRQARLASENERYERKKEKLQKDIDKQVSAINAKNIPEADKKAEITRVTNRLVSAADVEAEHNHNIAAINNQHDRLRDRFQQFNYDETYLIHETISGGNLFEGAGVPSLFLGFKVAKDGDNLTPSTSFAVFATHDGRRRIEIKFTDGGVLDEISDYTNLNYWAANKTNLANWDATISNATREERYMLTGNILQAWSDASAGGLLPGRLISYTDVDGNIKDGILMNSTWETGSLRSSGKPIDQARDQIEGLVWGDSIESTDGQVEIQKSRNFLLRVPKSKKDGAKYFQDERLVSLVRMGDFYQRRGKFEAEVSSENLPAVLQRLSELGVRVADESAENSWEEMDQPQANNDELRFREDPTAARVRQKEDPKKTIKVYKLMRLGDDGKLYPLFIDSSAGISIGEWYDAESPDLDFLKKIPSGVFLVNPADGSYTSLEDYANEHGFKAGKFPPKDAINEASVNGMRWVKITDTEKGQRRYEGENRKYENIGINGSGSVSTFAMRPGWHAGSLPTMRQIGKGAQKNLRDDSFVWVEGEVPADVDYNAEAQSNPDNDIPTRIPTDGYYMKSTNANAKAAQADKVGWYVAGSFKANRIISDAEARAVIDEYNAAHQEQEPVEYDYARESGKEFSPEERRVSAAEREATNATLDRMSEEMGIKINRVGRSQMPRGHKSDKGYYNPSTGEMTICMDNVTDERDAIATVLHETVGHHGLRQLFGDRFNDAMARIYAALDQKGKTWVNGYIARHPNADNTRAVEEYLSHLAESGNFKNTVWDNIKRIIGRIVDALFGTNGFLLTDNELNYILRASYENLKNPNWLNTVEGKAFDTLLKRQLGINETDPNKPTDPQGPDAGNLYRDGETKTAAEGFDSDMKKGRFVRKMEFQDHVVPVRKAYEHVQKETGKKEIAEDEDYAMRQNQVSSRAFTELHIFKHRQFDPAMETVAEIIGKLLGIPKRKVGRITMWLKGLVSGKPKNAEQRNAYKRVSNYLYAVSGLERNASKNAEIEQAKQAKLADAAAAGITDPAKLAEIEKKYDDMKRDWSGLTGLFNLPAAQWQDAEKKAQEMIDEFKLAVNDDAMLDELWDRLRACTDYNLEHAYKYGLLTREEFERLHGTASQPRMWEYYLPLRGFEEKTAEEEYSYANLVNTQADPVVKKMKGRVTQSADPIANILKIAQAEIVQGNNNWAKQALWRFVLNAGKNSLLTQAEPWYQKDPATGTWTLAQPADGESLEHFEERMKKNKELEPDNYKKGRKGLRLNLIMANKANRNAHAIHVKVGGIEKIIWVNGDAVLAKAVNGNFGWNNKFVQMWRSVNRYLSQAATSWSLKFTDKNVWRDTQFSRIATMVDEGQAYLHQLEKNWWANSMYGAQMVPIVRFMTAPVIKLVRDWENGTLIKKDSSELTERERMFVDFMTDGGATGYTVVQSMDDIKREVDRMIRNAGKGVGAFPLLGAYIKYASTLSEASELLTRFSVYQTSRQMGRSRQRSAYDAKETSVNFNRRGMQSGEGVWGWISAAMGLCYLFINPAIQSLDKFARLHKSHPWRMGAVDAAFIMMGFTNSLLNSMLAGMADGGGDGDDDDDKMGPDWYWNIPEWVRRSNMIIGSPFKKLGKWGYLVIPISLEYKGFYALGEMLSSIVQGKYADRDVATIANDVVGLVGEMLPLNPIEGYSTGDNIPQSIGRAVTPDIAAPWVNIATNRNFAGIPLRRENIYDQTEPRAYGFYASTPKVLTDMCIKVSEKTATWPVHIDVASGELRELLKGYGSGIYNYLEGFGKVAFSDDEHPRRWSDFPYLSGLTGYLEEDRRDSFSDNVIRKYKQNSDDVVTRIRAAAPNGLWNMDKVERELSAKEREKLPKDPEIIIYKYGDYLSKEANAAKILLGEDYILGREYFNETQAQTSGKQAKLAKNGSTRIVDKVTRPALKDLRKDWMDARKKYLEMPEGKTEEEQAAKDKAKEAVQKAYLEYCKAEQDIASKLLEEEYHNAQTKLKNGIPYERKKTLGERAYELTNSK